MYRVTDLFTTQDGRWDRHSEPYDIKPEMAQKYNDPAFTEKGCATCLFVKVVGGPSKRVRFWVDNGPEAIREVNAQGWANIPIFHSSAYNPDRGERGPWNVEVLDDNSDQDKVSGLGLPYSWHVSSFVVFEWVEGDSGNGDNGDGPDLPDEPGDGGELDLPLYLPIVMEVDWGGVKETYRGTIKRG